MDFNRFTNDLIQEGIEAGSLLDNPAFINAVNAVLNRYAAMEEALVLDDTLDQREVTAKIRAKAQMRRALLDVVDELNQTVIIGKNAEYDKETQ